MTPEERATQVVGAWYAGPYNLHHEFDQEIADVAAALRIAVLAERQRCAAIARCHITAYGGHTTARAILTEIEEG
jgi:hypothetical protein